MAAEKNKVQPESSEQSGFLGVIDAKIAALQKLRESFVAAASVGAMAEASDMAALMSAGSLGGGLGGGSIELPRGALLNKSLPAAIKLYLAAVKKKQTLKEIAAALKDGGVETTAKNFETPLTTAINRLKAAGEVFRFNDGWALTEFYPESLRNRIEKSTKDRAKQSAKKRGKGKKAARNQNKKAEAKNTVKPSVAKTTSTGGPGLEERLKAYLLTRGTEFTAVQELASQLKVDNVQVLRMTLGKMIKQEKIEKSTDGRYRLTKKVA